MELIEQYVRGIRVQFLGFSLFLMLISALFFLIREPLVGGLILTWSLLYLLCWHIFKKPGNGRWLFALILAILATPLIPIGTIFALFVLVRLLSREVRDYYFQ
ncbi:MAG: hypothetical protein ACMXYF_00280 [Candidatus Woesearchaeota archaeon]